VLSRYAVGGAVAATFYIEPAATEDIDVFAVLEPQPGTFIVTCTRSVANPQQLPQPPHVKPLVRWQARLVMLEVAQQQLERSA
jgi:hypothetical protein